MVAVPTRLFPPTARLHTHLLTVSLILPGRGSTRSSGLVAVSRFCRQVYERADTTCCMETYYTVEVEQKRHTRTSKPVYDVRAQSNSMRACGRTVRVAEARRASGRLSRQAHK